MTEPKIIKFQVGRLSPFAPAPIVKVKDNESGPVTVLAIGDPHFKVSNVRETDAMSDAIVRVATERRPDIIVVLGDVLDRHESIHVSPLTRATDLLARLTKIAHTFVLIGNHDLKNNRQYLSAEHPFASLKYWPSNMTIVDTTTVAFVKWQKFVFVPYVPPGDFVSALSRDKEWETANCIFAHQEFYGCKMGAIISDEGDKWDLSYPYVVSGHIHDYQEPQTNILYTGTPIQHAFGDAHHKTISLLRFRSRDSREHERIDLGLPHKMISRITCEEVSSFVAPVNCDLKIIIKGTSGEIKAIKKHPNIDMWKKAGHKISYKDLPSQRLIETPENPQAANNRSPAKFSAVLFNAIKDSPDLVITYNKIFGRSIEKAPQNSVVLSIVPPVPQLQPLTMNITGNGPISMNIK